VGSVGTLVRSASETVSLDKPRFIEIIGQSSINVVVADETVVESVHMSSYKVVYSDTLSSPTKVVFESTSCSSKETLPEFNVIPDVETSQDQPVSVVETGSEIPPH
jgi:ribonucleotide reductase beta subunit family protein with ferritin-like domain